MRVIQLTQGQHTVVDGDVYEWASKFKWYARKSRRTFYAVRTDYTVPGKRLTIFLHREILTAPADKWADHRDGDSLNNLMENLRLCEPRQNAQNYPKLVTNTSGFKGVSLAHGKWKCEISANGDHFYLGLFDTALEAAIRYDAEASRLHGEFARLNFPVV